MFFDMNSILLKAIQNINTLFFTSKETLLISQTKFLCYYWNFNINFVKSMNIYKIWNIAANIALQ
jgi:hypothetical protein